MRFLLAMLLGAALGSSATYLALEQPWAKGAAAEESSDAGPAVAAADKSAKKTRKRRKKRPDDSVEIALQGDIPELSAADRQLIWKGDSVELPPKRVDMESDSEARPLSGQEINSALHDQSARMLGCITESRGNAQLQATIESKLLVGGDGRVVKSRFRAPRYLFDHDFYACARRAAAAMRFPATGGHTVVEAPYELY